MTSSKYSHQIKPQLIFIDDLEVWVVRKSIKNLHLKVKPPDGRLEVSAPYSMSESTIANFVREKKDWILKTQKRIVSDPSNVLANPTQEQKQQWKDIVSNLVPQIIEYYEPLLNVKADKLAYRLMKSRWGSCQPATGRICINTRLALYPFECLEYVVVHELCHLRFSGHGANFKALLDEVMPDWRRRRKLLREYSI